jgi:hypothetical protein
MDRSRQSSEATLQQFLEKVFMSSLDSNKDKAPLLTFDDCRYRLESIFEEKYHPDRDFLDYLNVKKERNYEEFKGTSDQMK